MAIHTLSALARIGEDGVPSFSLSLSSIAATPVFGLAPALGIAGGVQ